MIEKKLTDDLSQFVAGYIITFLDGGGPEGKVLFRGTKNECEAFKSGMGRAITYDGDRPVKGGHFFITPAAAYDTFQEGGGTA